jgi:hypothetical protein
LQLTAPTLQKSAVAPTEKDDLKCIHHRLKERKNHFVVAPCPLTPPQTKAHAMRNNNAKDAGKSNPSFVKQEPEQIKHASLTTVTKA